MSVYQRLLPECILILLGLYLIGTNLLPQPQAADAKPVATPVAMPMQIGQPAKAAAAPVDYSESAVSSTTGGQNVAALDRKVRLVLKAKDKFVLAGIEYDSREELLEALREVVKFNLAIDPIDGSDKLKEEFYPWFYQELYKLQHSEPTGNSAATAVDGSGSGE